MDFRKDRNMQKFKINRFIGIKSVKKKLSNIEIFENFFKMPKNYEKVEKCGKNWKMFKKFKNFEQLINCCTIGKNFEKKSKIMEVERLKI